MGTSRGAEATGDEDAERKTGSTRRVAVGRACESARWAGSGESPGCAGGVCDAPLRDARCGRRARLVYAHRGPVAGLQLAFLSRLSRPRPVPVSPTETLLGAFKEQPSLPALPARATPPSSLSCACSARPPGSRRSCHSFVLGRARGSQGGRWCYYKSGCAPFPLTMRSHGTALTFQSTALVSSRTFSRRARRPGRELGRPSLDSPAPPGSAVSLSLRPSSSPTGSSTAAAFLPSTTRRRASTARSPPLPTARPPARLRIAALPRDTASDLLQREGCLREPRRPCLGANSAHARTADPPSLTTLSPSLPSPRSRYLRQSGLAATPGRAGIPRSKSTCLCGTRRSLEASPRALQRTLPSERRSIEARLSISSHTPVSAGLSRHAI